MAVPKRKTSKARRDKRRSNVWKLKNLNFSICGHCKKLKMPHKVCGYCGYYNNIKILEKKDA